MTYYNENDPGAAAWLRALIAGGHIAPGVVDERSILDVKPDDVRHYTQCHWFAGVGVWSLALRKAGWDDSRPVWTGSCPCFAAGTLILTDRGQIPIEFVQVGDRVLTHAGRFKPVIALMSDCKETVTVKGQGSSGIRTTHEHPFLARSGFRDNRRSSSSYGRDVLNDPEWRHASGLAGLHWATVARIPELAIPPLGVKDWCGCEPNIPADINSIEFARFLGYWVGDGWTSNASLKLGFVFLCGDHDDSELLIGLSSAAGLTGSISEEPTGSRYCIGSVLLSRWLDQHFGATACNKSLPTWLHGSRKEFRDAFLDGLALADGHHAIQPRGQGKIRVFTTCSKALALGVRMLLNQAGKSASITFHKPDRECIIEGRRVNENGFYRITQYESSRSFRFSDLHGWGRVRSVTRNHVAERVFNLEVADDNTYVADGIVVHNCQSFSAAGKGAGFTDERHLWPAWFHLIRECRPDVVFCEQVEAAVRFGWLDLVSNDLEGEGYAIGPAVVPACGVGAPHIRSRLWFVAERLAHAAGQGFGQQLVHARPETAGRDAANLLETAWRGRTGGPSGGETDGRDNGESGHLADADNEGSQGRRVRGDSADQCTTGEVGLVDGMAEPGSFGWQRREGATEGCVHDGSDAGRLKGDDGTPGHGETRTNRMADASCERIQRSGRGRAHGRPQHPDSGAANGLADSTRDRRGQEREDTGGQSQGDREEGRSSGPGTGGGDLRPGPTNGFWAAADWLLCKDGKWRPVESGTQPLASGSSARVGRLRGYGNAICAEVAVGVIRSYIETVEERTAVLAEAA